MVYFKYEHQQGDEQMRSKTAFITGASRGIGAAIAERFAKEGYRLAINGRNEERLRQKAEQIAEQYHVVCVPFAGDAGDAGFVKDVMEEIDTRLGGVDVLVNNAGIAHIGLLTEMPEEKWEQVIRTNLTSVFLCSKYAAKQMLHKKSGKIVNISSVWGNVGASCEVAYSASKGGVNALTRALAKELAPSNIQVNAIACGVIDTDMNRCFTKGERQALEQELPCGRYGTPQEVAELAAFLADAPAYLTGQIVTLDGGWI